MRMYCVVAKESLDKMGGNRGKLAAQAGHAYLHAYWDAEDRQYALDEYAYHHGQNQQAAKRYRASGAAKKVCLVVDTVEQLEALHDAYRPICGVSLVKDAGKTVFGEPTVTCLGIGPIADGQIGDDLKALKVLI